MPNFWSTMLQQAYECFNGPRTVDYEFEKKAQELKLVKEKVYQVKSIITTFPERTGGIQAVCDDIYNTVSLAFDKDKCYYGFADDVCNAHKALGNAYSNCQTLIVKLAADTAKWDASFGEVEALIKKRAEARKIYDHYDEKMEKLVKERNEKLAKGRKESVKDCELFERNEDKFRKAAQEYISSSNTAYYKIQELLDFRYKMIIPVLADFIESERVFFNKGAQILNYFNNIQPRIQQLHLGFQKTPINYDAVDYLRGRHIIGREVEMAKGQQLYMQKGVIMGGKPKPTLTIESSYKPQPSGMPMNNQMQNPYNNNNINNGYNQNPYNNPYQQPPNRPMYPQNNPNIPPQMPPSNEVPHMPNLPEYHPPELQEPVLKNPYEEDNVEVKNPYEEHKEDIGKNYDDGKPPEEGGDKPPEA